MAHDVFLSHSAKDKPVADAVCAGLERAGIRCWIAPRDILHGATWGEAIINAISSSRVLVVVFSSHSNSSQQVLREVERAVSKGKVIIPFRVEDVLPSGAMEYYLSCQQWLDALTPPLERHIRRLVDTVSLLLRGQAEAGEVSPADDRPATNTAHTSQLSADVSGGGRGSPSAKSYEEEGVGQAEQETEVTEFLSRAIPSRARVGGASSRLSTLPMPESGQPEIISEFTLTPAFPPGLVVNSDFVYYTSEVKNAIKSGLLTGGSLEGLYRAVKEGGSAREITRCASFHNPALSKDYIYFMIKPAWGPTLTIGRVAVSPASEFERLVQYEQSPYAVDFAPDPEGEHLYLVEEGDAGGIKVMSLGDEREKRSLLLGYNTTPPGYGRLVVDQEFLYYVGDDPNNNALFRIPKSGGSPTRLTPLTSDPTLRLRASKGCNLGQDEQYIYAVDETDRGIKRAPKSGGPPTVVVSKLPHAIRRLAVGADHVYFCFRDKTQLVGRVPKLGAPEKVDWVVKAFDPHVDQVFEILVDGDYLYFGAQSSETYDGAIYRLRLPAE